MDWYPVQAGDLYADETRKKRPYETCMAREGTYHTLLYLIYTREAQDRVLNRRLSASLFFSEMESNFIRLLLETESLCLLTE